MMVLLTTFIMPLSVLGSWTSIRTKVRSYYALLLILSSGMIGLCLARDLFLFYVMWEVMLVPMYFIIGIWGGERRIYASIKFFIYTFLPSLLMLVAIIYLGLHLRNGAGAPPDFSYDHLLAASAALPGRAALWLFSAFFLAFAVKVPMFPFHTWLPDAHVEAPTAGSVFLASVLLKMGAYGFLRFTLPMLPDATETFTPIMVALSLIAILYGAYMALAQADLNTLIAYSSVSHMGFVTLGIFALNAQGIEGAILQMVNHGITTGALFLCVGAIYERTHSRMIADNAGLARPIPRFATVLAIFALSSLGLPGTNSFVGEFLVLVGTFLWSQAAAAIAALGVILAAVYLLWMVQRVAFGLPDGHNTERLRDLNLREMATFVPLVVLVFWIGLFPNPVLTAMHASVNNLIEHVDLEEVSLAVPNP